MFATKIAAKFNIPLIFYGEMQGKGGKEVSHKAKTFAESGSQGGSRWILWREKNLRMHI